MKKYKSKYTKTKLLLTPESIRATMPQVGDRLVRTPTFSGFMSREQSVPRPCVVDYVHPEHLWYRVRFENGLTECYKLPMLKEETD